MKHKHYEMIVAKAANMDLVVFSKNESGWKVSTFEDIVCWPSYDHFLCSPQHNEDGQCLHWLNGGQTQTIDRYGNWIICNSYNSKVPFFQYDRWVCDEAKFRIKPKKENRWICIKKSNNEVLPHLYESLGQAKLINIPRWWSYHQIEIEV